MMEVDINKAKLFPRHVESLLKSMYDVGFFGESMLVGSWVMPIYGNIFGIRYVLKTMDIDFALEFATGKQAVRVNLPQLLTNLGYLSSYTSFGLEKFSLSGFTIEFISHRRGGKRDDVYQAKKWGLNASPLPFVDVLLRFPMMVNFGDYKLRVPIPEAFFVQKMITAQRRPSKEKKEKDLDQCRAISANIDQVRLIDVLKSMKLSTRTRRAINKSCGEINFPRERLGV
jgi:hypothetical protein